MKKAVMNICIAGAAAIALSGCEFGDAAKTRCEMKNINYQQTMAKCEVGDRYLYAPRVWGNAQTPILAANTFCDPRKPIVHNDSAVSCIFNPANLKGRKGGDQQ